MPASEALVTRYGQRYDDVRRRAALAIVRLWLTFGSVGDLEPFAIRAAAVSAAAQTEVTSLVAGYLALFLDRPAQALAVTIRGGADPLEVYRRPGITARAKLAAGRPFGEAMAAARARAENAAATDVALAHREAARHGMGADPRVVGYRRVLTGASCRLCATASTQRYHVDRLMPLHGHCDCRVVPIVGDQDPGQVINHRTLDQLQQAGPDYWRAQGYVDTDGKPVDPTEIGTVTETAVHEHGELGPMLTDARDHFTGPGAIPR